MLKRPMEPYKDYYQILQVAADVTPEGIKKAFRSLSLKYHPDKNGNSEESTARFRLILNAYETLGDHGARREYDNFLSHSRVIRKKPPKTTSRS